MELLVRKGMIWESRQALCDRKNYSVRQASAAQERTGVQNTDTETFAAH